MQDESSSIVLLATAFAIAIAKDKTLDELDFLSDLLTQVADTLAKIGTTRGIQNKGKK